MRQDLHNRHISGSGYRKRYIKMIERGPAGPVHRCRECETDRWHSAL